MNDFLFFGPPALPFFLFCVIINMNQYKESVFMMLKKTVSIFIAAVMLVSSALCLVSCSSPEIIDVPDDMKVIIYVDAEASEKDADGSKEHPFATLEAARDAVRTTGRDGIIGIDVILSGTFFLDTAFVMDDPADSGTESCPIVWKGSEEGAHITGGVTINTSDMAPVADTDPLCQRLDPTCRDIIVCFDMKTAGVTASDVARGEKSIYPSMANAVVYAGNERLSLARYPDDGYVLIDSFVSDGNGDYLFGYDAKHNERIKNWQGLDDIFVNGYFKFFWAQDRTKVISFDTENSVMNIFNSDGYPPAEGMVFYWFNIPEELTQPGEYYISSDAVLYAILPEGAETLTYPTIPTGFLNVKADYITFDNLYFSDSRERMGTINGDHVTVSNCLFERGGYSVMNINGSYNTFENNEIGHFAYGGVTMNGGDPDTLTESHNLIYNNYIHDFSEGLATYCPAVNIQGCGATVSHNEIAHSNHNALTWSGHNHIVEYNEFYDICNNTDDAGVCYAGRTLDWYGNIFRYNYLHEVGNDTLMQEFGGGCGGHGIYYDDGLGGQTAYGNVFENFRFGFAFAVGGGSDHIIEGNVFINCDTAIGYDERYYAIYRETGGFSHQLLENVYDKYLNNEILSKAFPTITQMNSNGDLTDPWFWVSPARSSIKNNVAFCTAENESKQYTLADSVYLFSTYENNKVKTYAEGKLPTAEVAVEESWLDIPFEEIGRNK